MKKLIGSDILKINKMLGEEFGFEISYFFGMSGRDVPEAPEENEKLAKILNRVFKGSFRHKKNYVKNKNFQGY